MKRPRINSLFTAAILAAAIAAGFIHQRRRLHPPMA